MGRDGYYAHADAHCNGVPEAIWNGGKHGAVMVSRDRQGRARTVLFVLSFLPLAWFALVVKVLGVAAIVRGVGGLACFLGALSVAWSALNRSKARRGVYVPTTESDVAAEPAEAVRLRVAVVGAGASGLVAAKELVGEGHAVTVYEKYDRVGGVFYFGSGKGGVYEDCYLTISNYTMAFSDFFPRAFRQGGTFRERARFWSHREYHAYLEAYAAHFGLFDKAEVKLSCAVSRVRVAGVDDAGLPSAFEVSDARGDTATFDRVVVCNGAHHSPRVVEFPGQAHSPIAVCHSSSYKRARGDPRFEGKRVVCVGLGETGADLAAFVADVAKDA